MDPQLEEGQLDALQQRFRELVESQGATIRHIERWDRRKLAYEIKGRREGHYVVMNFSGEPAAEAELGRVLRITDGILRHLIVRMDERRAEQLIQEAQTAYEARKAAAVAAAEAAAAAEAEAAAEAAAAESAAPVEELEEPDEETEAPVPDADEE